MFPVNGRRSCGVVRVCRKCTDNIISKTVISEFRPRDDPAINVELSRQFAPARSLNYDPSSRLPSRNCAFLARSRKSRRASCPLPLPLAESRDRKLLRKKINAPSLVIQDETLAELVVGAYTILSTEEKKNSAFNNTAE